MVLLAASICSKGGKTLVSRQFIDMPRTRIEGLLASFPKLLSSRDQHTFVETDSIRYVYKPLEDVYMVLVTNKQSNILQDIETLHLFARVVSDNCKSLDEKEILNKAFELVAVFDELVSLGYAENVSVTNIRTILEMESQEERIQAEIARQKEKEAKEEMNRKMRALELQKKEAAKRGFGGFSGVSSEYSSKPSFDSYSKPATTYNAPASTPAQASSNVGKGKGMQLGRKKSNAQSMAEVIKSEERIAPPVAQAPAVQLPAVQTTSGESVTVIIEEKISATANRDGGLSNFEIKGDLMLLINDSAKAQLKMTTNCPSDPNIKFNTHPNVNKQLFSSESTIALKDPTRPFPTGQPLGVLKWRYTSKNEDDLPLAINCWPSPGAGSCEVNIEYELLKTEMQLENVVISIPVPGGAPSVSHADGHYRLDRQKRSLEWEIPVINSSTSSGTLEFVVPGSEDAAGFFPVRVNFTSSETVCPVSVGQILDINNGSVVDFKVQKQLSAEDYIVA